MVSRVPGQCIGSLYCSNVGLSDIVVENEYSEARWRYLRSCLRSRLNIESNRD